MKTYLKGTAMFDPDFDPLATLEQLKQMNHQLARAHNDNIDLQRQMVNQINLQTEAINKLDECLGILGKRLTEIESKINENKNKDD